LALLKYVHNAIFLSLGSRTIQFCLCAAKQSRPEASTTMGALISSIPISLDSTFIPSTRSPDLIKFLAFVSSITEAPFSRALSRIILSKSDLQTCQGGRGWMIKMLEESKMAVKEIRLGEQIEHNTFED
jgi:hypothetical protein